MAPNSDDSVDLGELFPLVETDLLDASAHLARRADAAGLVDIAYRVLDTPVGSLLLAATPRGLVRVAYEREDFDQVLRTLADRLSPRILRLPARLDEPVRELTEYFAGTRQQFDLSLDHALSSGFRGSVQRHLTQIGYGQTRTYKQVAELAGRPRAVRAVGTACATNPLPVVVPCHRVLRTDGHLGGYIGGTDIKATLLHLEGAS